MTWGGIPTAYTGVHFRSRLEARWAALFTKLNMPWTYDFLVGRFFIEVKPETSDDGLMGHASKVMAAIDEAANAVRWEATP